MTDTYQRLPVPEGLSNWDHRVQLDGSEYVLRFLWQDRVKAWSVNLSDQDNVAIVTGLKLVCNLDLLRKYTHDARTPRGLLVARHAPGTIDVASFADLQTGTVELLYYPVDFGVEDADG